MDIVYFSVWFMVTVAMIWDTRRVHLQSQAIIRDIATSAERIEASAERIAQMTTEVLRRTPERYQRLNRLSHPASPRARGVSRGEHISPS